MTRAVLSIGSNLGDRLAHLQVAVDAVRQWLVATSVVVQTPPWGPVPQDDFLNAVLVVADPRADPATWLRRAHEAEDRAARVREVRWGPRTLDVDVVTVLEAAAGADGADRAGQLGEVRSDDPTLTLPHPRAADRAFVLVPWAQVDPGAVLGGRPLGDLLAALDRSDVESIVPRPDLVLLP